MSNRKRLVLILLALGITGSSFAGCSKKTESTSESSSAPKEIVEISALAYDRGSIPSTEGTLEDNWFTKWVNEKTQALGVKVKYVPVPNSQREQKLATMLASGDAPDVSFTYDSNVISNYTANGGLTDLTSLVDKYGANLKKNIDQSYFNQVKINNQLTSIPLITNQSVDATWIRKDWLDKLNLKAPTNIDEFYNVLKAFKEKDPGNLGDKNMPFALPAATGFSFGSIDSSILPAFMKSAPTAEQLVTPWYFWPEAKEAVRFLNKLYNEKLMGQFIIDKDGAQIKQKIITGQLGATINFAHYMYHSAYGNIEENLQKNMPEASYTATYPWKAADSKENYYQFFKGGISNSMRFFVPKSSKHADAAVKFMDFMSTEEYINTMYYGFADKDYKVVNGIPQYIDDAAKARCTWVQPAYQSTVAQNAKDDQKYLQFGTAVFNQKFADQYVKESFAGEKAYKFAIPFISAAKPASDKYKADLGNKWDQYLAKLIIGTSAADFDKAFDDAIKTLKAEGGDEVIKEAVELYKKQATK
jgi:putative aldouronate transport system substrate-binding protein